MFLYNSIVHRSTLNITVKLYINRLGKVCIQADQKHKDSCINTLRTMDYGDSDGDSGVYILECMF